MQHENSDWNHGDRKARSALSAGETLAKLRLILSDCRKRIAEQEADAAGRMNRAASKIEAAIELLTVEQRLERAKEANFDVENPSRELPTCSISGCGNAAGAVIDGSLLCGLHASQALLHRRSDRS